MKSFVGLVAFLSVATVTASPLYLGKNGPVVKAEAGTAGMDPSIFRPLQARGQANNNIGAVIRRSWASADAPVKKRQDSIADEAAALLAAETAPTQMDTEASKQSLDRDALAANGLTPDSTAFTTAPAAAASAPSSEASAAAEDSSESGEEADGMTKRGLGAEDLKRRKVMEAYAAVEKLAILDPEDAQLAKAFIPAMKKRQASKVTVTTTTTVPPAANVETVTATATETASAAAAAADTTKTSAAGEATKASAAAEASKTSADTAASKTSAAADATSASASADATTSSTAAASASADASSSSTSSAEAAAATMNANANSSSTESTSSSSSSSTSNAPAGATAAANGGRTTFDNSQGVEVQIGAIQAAQANSATQTDLQPGDKGTDTNAASSQQSVPDAANGGPLPQPTGPPNNGIAADVANGQPPAQGVDAANGQPSTQGADAANAQAPPPSADVANAQTTPPSADVANAQTPPPSADAATAQTPSPGPDAATIPGVDAANAGTPPIDTAPASDIQALAQGGDVAVLDDEDEEGEEAEPPMFRERLIRRTGTLLYF